MNITVRNVFLALATVCFANPIAAQPLVGPNPPEVEDVGVVSPEDINRAREAGRADGRRAGEVEGRNRGHDQGQQEGYARGHRDGFNRCYEDERRRHYDDGYYQGYRIGERRGLDEGESNGEREGDDRGETDGRSDGRQRASRDASAAASGPGREQGRREADATDAEARGFQDGLTEGEQRAVADALRVDYPRGRLEYRDERFAEAIENRDEIDQRPTQRPKRITDLDLGKLNLFDNKNEQAIFDERLALQNQSPEERAAYEQGYQEGYRNAYRSAFDDAHRRAFASAERDGQREGCAVAQRENYRRHFDEGYHRGTSEGYARGYREAYDRAYRDAYATAFRQASDFAYRDSYDAYYQEHFETARRSAYRERVNALYERGRQAGFTQQYNESYPRHARTEHARGRSDETQDFELRPVRLIESSVSESIQNGLLEPGEPLFVRAILRSFSEESVAAGDVTFSLRTTDQRGAVIEEPSATIVRGLARKSLTGVSNLLQFRLTEESIRQATSLTLDVFFRGRNIGTQVFALKAQFWAELSFSQPPVLKEGLPSIIQVKVKNASGTTSLAPAIFEALSDSKLIEIKQNRLTTTSIAPNETRIIEFTVIARSPDMTIRAPLAFIGMTSEGRRIGLMDFSGDIPVMNDYRIVVDGPTQGLRNPGITRVPYKIRNVSSRLLFKGLQLRARIIASGDDAAENDFVVLGPNPQYIIPLENNQTTTFLIPILAKNLNNGATIELEVQEAGNTVVIHRQSF